MTNFVFRVRVKPSQECDWVAQPSPRLNIAVRENAKVLTKQELSFKKFRPQGFDELCLDKKLIILCAEDSYYNMETLRITFANIGLTDYVHYVSNGQEAIDFCIREATNCLQLYQKVVTLVILDHTMPYKSGVEALQEIRAFYEGLHKPNEDCEVNARHIRKPKFAMFSAY